MAKKEWKPKRVRSEEERSTGGNSSYITLKEDGEKFLGYALFEADPAEDEVGYYEYHEHWVTGGKGQSVPCAGDQCPFCEDGDRPKDRAKSLWLVTTDEKGNKLDPPQLRIFNLNSRVIKQFTEMRGEGDKIQGRLFRVSRLDDNGNYALLPKDPTLKKSEVKEHLKSKDAPDFDALVTAQLRKAMEGMSVRGAMDDDDDDDEPTEKKSKKKDKPAKSEKKSKKAAKEEWPDDGLDEEEVTVESVDEEGNFITVESDKYDGTINIYTTEDIEFDLTDLSEGDEVTVTTSEKDGDGDYVLTAEPEAEESDESDEEDGDEEDGDDEDGDDEGDEEESEDGLPDVIEDETFEVVTVDAPESTIDVKSDDLDLEFTLYFLDSGPASKVDFDDYEPGAKIIVSAEKDSTGDLVATKVPKIAGAKEKKSKKSDTKKSGAKDKKDTKKKSSAKDKKTTKKKKK